jgi:NAD(P)H-flavin reductase
MSIPENSVLVNEAKILQVRNLTPSTYVLRFEKNEMNFKAGQYITLGLPDDYESREYSIYSPADKDYLQVLIKEVEEGVPGSEAMDHETDDTDDKNTDKETISDTDKEKPHFHLVKPDENGTGDQTE